jgi:hypothetical protein
MHELQKAQSEAFKHSCGDSSIEESRQQIAQIMLDLNKCADFLNNRYEKQLYEFALREIQLSLLSALNASYRQAFVSLRLALEHWFSGIAFSTNEICFRSWVLNEKDVSWSEINDPETGVLSERFVHIFWPASKNRAPKYRNIANSVYRECSEYVHGNLKTHLILPKQLQYDRALFISWKEKLDTMSLLFVYTLVVRFSAELQGKAEEPCAAVVLGSLGHLSEARELISGER